MHPAVCKKKHASSSHKTSWWFPLKLKKNKYFKAQGICNGLNYYGLNAVLLSIRAIYDKKERTIKLYKFFEKKN